ncbi:hypothetical protein L596_030226 [Steinernema carpocapsae]|uniref:Uncharacterized protein n=1 Tax=Steinernema carpocapsae TaxID=34508 RepID=A0A4U5LS34_STECR|nr:hypothetical protein L596_030226 [Steinernema carpocapsae]
MNSAPNRVKNDYHDNVHRTYTRNRQSILTTKRFDNAFGLLGCSSSELQHQRHYISSVWDSCVLSLLMARSLQNDC